MDDIWMIGTYNNNFYQVQDSTQLNSWDHVRGLANDDLNLILVYDIYFHFLRSRNNNNDFGDHILNYLPQQIQLHYNNDFIGHLGNSFHGLAHNSYPRIFINPRNPVNLLNRIEPPILHIPDTCINNHQGQLEYRTGTSGLYLHCNQCNSNINFRNMLR